MARDTWLRDGESVVVTVTTAPFGIVGPAVVTVLAVAAVVALGLNWSFAHAHEAWFAGLLVGPPAVVLGGRWWRWHSRRITVTTERVRTQSGTLSRRAASYELSAVVAVHLEQRRRDRLARRGRILLETGAGMVVLERVRRPDALGRVIDHQRHQMDRAAERRLDDAESLRYELDEGFIDEEDYRTRWRTLFGPRWHR